MELKAYHLCLRVDFVKLYSQSKYIVYLQIVFFNENSAITIFSNLSFRLNHSVMYSVVYT